MSKTARITAILLCLCLALSACGQTEKTEPQNSQPAAEPVEVNKEIKTPVKGSSIVIAHRNPLDYSEDLYHYINTDSGSKTEYRYWQELRGLKNEEIQTAINGRLQEFIDEASKGKIPPFRGTALIKDGYVVSYTDASIYMTWSCNDYISYSCSRSISGTGIGGYSLTSGMTFDLRTGDELKLSDVFAPDSGYKELINSKIWQYIRQNSLDDEGRDNYTDEDLILVSPFKGITDDQQFFLSDFGLNIIIGPENREFDFGKRWGYCASVTVCIDYSEMDGMLLIDRANDLSIYDQTELSQPVLVRRYSSDVHEMDDLCPEEYHINAIMEKSYSSMTPANIVSDLDKTVDSLRPNVDYFKEYLLYNDDHDIWIDLGTRAYCENYGPFYVTEYYTSTYDTANKRWGSEVRCAVYDSSGKRLKVSDIVTGNVDLKAYMQEDIQEYLDEQASYGNYLPNGETAAQLTLEMSFSLNQEGIQFYTRPFAVRGQYSSYYTYAVSSISFDDIGFDNLNSKFFY